MKAFSVIFILTIFLSANLFAQTDSSSSNIAGNKTLSSNKIESKSLKPLKKISIGKTSDQSSGMVIGAAIGAGAGVLIGLAAGSISMEPHSDNSVPFGTLVVAGVAGAFVGAIVGGLVSK